MPEYTLGSITTDLHGEITEDIWQQITRDVKSSVTQPFYEELLYDAINFQMNMGYDAAALYAAIAIELMLEEACKALLTSQGSLTDDQAEAVLSNRNTPLLVQLIRSLDSGLKIDGKGIQKATNSETRLHMAKHVR